MTASHRRLLARLQRLSRFASRWHRDAWLQEWSAEIASAPTVRSWALTVGAVAHLVWLWRREWQLDSMWADVRYGIRGLIRRPAFSVTAAATLALGVGATTTLLTVISGVLLKPLPFPSPEHLVRVSETREGGGDAGSGITREILIAWSRQSSTLSHLAGYSASAATLRTDTSKSERATVVTMMPALFDTLGVRPTMGMSPAADARGADHLVWLADPTWRHQFNSASDVLGRKMFIDGSPFTVAGVLGPGVAFPDDKAAAWILFDQNVRFLDAVGRLATGATVEQAASEGTAVSRNGPDLGSLAVAVFGSNGPARVVVTPLLSSMTAQARPLLLTLFAAAGLLLLTGIANVASLQLAYAAGRRREFAIRSAIGAGAIRTVRQLVVEHTILGLVGAVGAVALAFWWNRLLPTWLPAGLPRVTDIAFDVRALLLTLGLSVASSQLFGLLPLWFVRRATLTDALAEDGSAPTGGGSRTRVARLRSGILVAQIVATTLLLVGAGLLGRSMYTLATADRGYDLSHLLTAEISMPEHDFTRIRRVEVLETMIARISVVPGVTHAAASDIFPLVPLEFPRTIDLPPSSPAGVIRRVKVASRTVSRDYFATLGMRIVQGRGFSDADRMDSPPSVVVNRAFVRDNVADRSALGIVLPIRFSQSWQGATIIGVVDDVIQQTGVEPASSQVFACYCQVTQGLMADVPAMAIRTTGDPAALTPTLRAMVQDVAPAASLASAMTMETRLSARLAVPRLLARLVIGFSSAALFIAGIGLVGALGHRVTLRAREMAIRSALGASPGVLAGGIARSALAMTSLGTIIGLGAAAVVSQWLSHGVDGVDVHDPVVFGAVPVLLLAVALIASVLPARRAARVDPARLLRS